MSTGLHYLDLGLGIAVFGAMFWWMLVLCVKPGAPRKRETHAKAVAAHQPWDDDKAGGRGNR